MLIRLVYASRSSGNLTPIEVKDILQRSQRNNTPLGITGVLLLSNGVFLQCLEGDHLVVNTLYHRILLDSRHRDPAILRLVEIDQRLYVGWSMGLVPTTEANMKMLLKYSTRPEFNPFDMRAAALDSLCTELVAQSRIISG